MKNKGTSTCVVCGFVIKDHVHHLQIFDRHLKSKKHSKDQAWYCQVDNCRCRNFKKGGNRTCTGEKIFSYRSEKSKYEKFEKCKCKTFTKLKSNAVIT